MAHDKIGDRKNIGTAEREWDSSIDFSSQSNTYKLVDALLSEADRIDSSLDVVYDEHTINSATGKSLDQFGKFIGISRDSGESDNSYRTRIKAESAQKITTTDYESFVEFVVTVLSTNINNVDFFTNYDANAATVTVSADQALYDSVNIDNNIIADIISDGVPAGHRALVQARGNFELKTDGDTDNADFGLTSDSIETGGTLSADIT